MSISEEADVETIDGALHQHLCVFEDLLLGIVLAEARVERILLFLIASVDAIFLQLDFQSVLVNDCDNRKSTDELQKEMGSKLRLQIPVNDFDIQLFNRRELADLRAEDAGTDADLRLQRALDGRDSDERP